MSETEIYAAALEHYGRNSQEDKLIEEMAELTQALLKLRRHGVGPGKLGDEKYWLLFHEEFADVCIVMEQLKTEMDPILLGNFKSAKLGRLKTRMANGDQDKHKYKS